MSRGNFNIPYPINEPVLTYAPGTAEREEVQAKYRQMFHQSPIDVPMYIGSEEVRTEDKRAWRRPTIISTSSGILIMEMKPCEAGH